ncbi:MAG TPA: GntR family transcriptional regulator [Ilumatobacter sp.]
MTEVVDRTSPMPLWAQVLDDLRDRLGRHEFDARFPTDTELVERYGVSRQTVREAVRRLSAEGLLDRERGRGTFVRTSALHHPVGTLPEIFGSIREHLGPVVSIVRRVGRTADPDVAERLGLDPADTLIVIERVRHTADGPIAHDTAWLPAAIGEPLLTVDFTTAVLADEVRDRCGRTADDVDEQLGAAVASRELRALLHMPTNVALLTVATRSSERGLPFECRRVSFRADRLHLTSRWTSNERTRPTIGAAATSP